MTLKQQAKKTLKEFKRKPDCLCHITSGKWGTNPEFDFPELKKIIQQSVNNYHDLIGYEYKESFPLEKSALLPEYYTGSPEFYEARVIFMKELIKQL